MAMVHTHTDTLNSLLRGELSAFETYQQALDKVGDEPGADDLRRITEEHRQAVIQLGQHISQQHGDKPDSTSGAWGTFTHAVEGTAKLFGNVAALKALKEGEEHGIKEYEEALHDPDLAADCRALISATLLPRARAHIPVLDRLISAQ